MQLELALSLPRDHRSVPVARHLVRAGMRILGVDADCTNDVEVALSEACTNLIQHGTPAVEYQVQLHLDDQRCQLHISLVGHSMAGAFGQPPPATRPNSDAEHGRGLLVMRALMDRVGFRSMPGAGSVVSLEKRLTYADTERLQQAPAR